MQFFTSFIGIKGKVRMSNNAMNYFENIIIPLIQANYPNIISDMDIMILGSVGLGIDDEIFPYCIIYIFR